VPTSSTAEKIFAAMPEWLIGAGVPVVFTPRAANAPDDGLKPFPPSEDDRPPTL
jgi:hypothetical protein